MKSMLILLLGLRTYLSFGYLSIQPEQIHLSYGDNVFEITVTWVTYEDPGISVVEYGIGGLILSEANTNATRFMYGDHLNRTQFIHRVKLKDLTPSSTYEYHCGSDYGWSPLFTFNTPPDDGSWVPKLAIYGDLGNDNAQSLPRLQEEVQRGMYDAILHVGDFAYDFNSEDGEVGDMFMRQIEPVAGYLPYMTAVGNHENANNFSDYRNRFTMPGDTEGLWYSFNMGPAHFIIMSTEVYYYINWGFKQVVKQYEWLENDLMEATSVENRTIRPWIFVLGHRPMYCSNNNTDDCTNYETYTRVGFPYVKWFGLEQMFYYYGVDVMIWAHEHSYERLWPMYNYVMYNGSYEEPYRNPKAPVHVTTGSGGCSEIHDYFKHAQPIWSAFRSVDYGYTRLKIYNASHIYFEQVSDDKLGEVIDSFWIIKDKHESYLKATILSETVDNMV